MASVMAKAAAIWVKQVIECLLLWVDVDCADPARARLQHDVIIRATAKLRMRMTAWAVCVVVHVGIRECAA